MTFPLPRDDGMIDKEGWRTEGGHTLEPCACAPRSNGSISHRHSFLLFFFGMWLVRTLYWSLWLEFGVGEIRTLGNNPQVKSAALEFHSRMKERSDSACRQIGLDRLQVPSMVIPSRALLRIVQLFHDWPTEVTVPIRGWMRDEQREMAGIDAESLTTIES